MLKRGFFFLLTMMATRAAHGYANFIGYGYTTCITCHYNPNGHGPLNDYGRAIFAQEIAARPFIPPSITDEQLGEDSGFLPGKELPSWLRPGLKYRDLWFQQNPGTATAVKRYIHMQREVNLALQSDPTGTAVLVLTWNQLSAAQDLYGRCEGGEPCVSSYFREQYLRYRVNRNLYLSGGLFDKVYGIRNVDHMAVNRRSIGLGIYDQTHGVTAHYMASDWDVAVQLHLGHLNKDDDARDKGFSTSGEYEIGEKHRLGASLLSTESATARKRRVAIHDRWGLSHTEASSLLWEFGLIEDLNKATDVRKAGTYAWIETMINLTRGYNLLSTLQRIQSELKSSTPEYDSWSIGLLTFPFPRTEVRMSLVNSKNYSVDSSTADAWQAQGLFHVSW